MKDHSHRLQKVDPDLVKEFDLPHGGGLLTLGVKLVGLSVLSKELEAGNCFKLKDHTKLTFAQWMRALLVQRVV